MASCQKCGACGCWAKLSTVNVNGQEMLLCENCKKTAGTGGGSTTSAPSSTPTTNSTNNSSAGGIKINITKAEVRT